MHFPLDTTQASNNIRKLVRVNKKENQSLTKPLIEEWQIELMEFVMLQMGGPATFDAAQEAVLDRWAEDLDDD